MENASDALKIAFAVFVFVIAMSIVFSLLSQVKTTADTILFYSDKTNYYEYDTGLNKDGRIVGEEAIISSLYSLKRESTYIKIKTDNNIEREFTPSSGDEDIKNFISDYLGKGKMYSEKISEVTIGGEYKVGEDGTRITVQAGQHRTYIIYEVQ